MSTDNDSLNKARRLVVEGRRIVWQQKGLIARLRAAGFNTLDAERTLRVLEENLKIFQRAQRLAEAKRALSC
jgi:hypothetical protein